MTSSQRKGDLLEASVRVIEEAILRSSPSYNDKTFKIEGKKIVTIGGVRHEIDIFVTVDLGGGYETYFIFECKNWTDKVDKNEIIVFAEKINAVRAQKGFFVARSYTGDAEAQAKKDPRIELLRVNDLPLNGIPIPLGFHGINPQLQHISLQLIENLQSTSPGIPVDIMNAVFSLDGKQTDLLAYAKDWGESESALTVNQFRSESAEQGPHELIFEAQRDFAQPMALVNGHRILRMKLTGRVVVNVIPGKIISHFEVKGRGRAISIQLDIDHPEIKGEIVATFAAPATGQH